MSTTVQNEICDFVREIITDRTGEEISVALRPEVIHRNVPAVEELWDALSRGYAVEHTRVESFERQIENIAKITRLLTPVRVVLSDRLPGYFELAVQEQETTAARVDFGFAHEEVARLVLGAAGKMTIGETILLRSERLPFVMRLRLRHKLNSGLVLQSNIDGDAARLRLERFRRAFNEKCPKLTAWAGEGRKSVLVLESDDYQHANYSVSYGAVKQILAERSDQPDIIVYVETDAYPWSAWVYKDGERIGNAAMRTRDGGYRYERGRGSLK
jgi:hypothetical protein